MTEQQVREAIERAVSLTPEQRDRLQTLATRHADVGAALALIDQQAEQIRQTDEKLQVLARESGQQWYVLELPKRLMALGLWREPGSEGV